MRYSGRGFGSISTRPAMDLGPVRGLTREELERELAGTAERLRRHGTAREAMNTARIARHGPDVNLAPPSFDEACLSIRLVQLRAALDAMPDDAPESAA